MIAKPLTWRTCYTLIAAVLLALAGCDRDGAVLEITEPEAWESMRQFVQQHMEQENP